MSTYFKTFGEKVLRAQKQGTLVLFKRAVIFLIFVPVVLLIRIIRPIVCFRFSPLLQRIGHFAYNTELYLCLKEIEGIRGIDFFYFHILPCNQQLARMWKKNLRIAPIAGCIDKVNRMIPGGEAHYIPEIDLNKDPKGLMAMTKPHLSFTESEEKEGERQLRLMGVPEGKAFICFISRSSQYLKAKFPDTDYSYHNYRDTDIADYMPAVKELVRRGYLALRMGEIVDHPLVDPIPGIIDYASFYRSDFMDIYLAAKCCFYLGDTCGFGLVPVIFRRPVIVTNMVPLETVTVKVLNNYLILPKKLWLRHENRLMTFTETLKVAGGLNYDSHDLTGKGIDVIDNTPSEILDVVIEMDERLRGVWETNDEYEDLQRRFWSLFGMDIKSQSFQTRIGSKFLLNNRALFETQVPVQRT